MALALLLAITIMFEVPLGVYAISVANDVNQIVDLPFSDDDDSEIIIDWSAYDEHDADDDVIIEDEEYDDADQEELAALVWDGVATVLGVVTNLENDHGAAGVTVTLYGPNGEVFSGTTDQSGRYTINILLTLDQDVEDDDEDHDDAVLTMADLDEFLAGSRLVATGNGFIRRTIDAVAILDQMADEETVFAVDFEMLQGASVAEGMRVVTGVVNFGDDIMANQQVVIDGQTLTTNVNGRFIHQVPINQEMVTIEAQTTAQLPLNILEPNGEIGIFAVTSGTIELYLETTDLIVQDVSMHLIGVVPTEERVPTVHHISTAAHLNQFLAGTLGTNYDTFILMNDITAIGSNNAAFPANFAPTGGTSGTLQNHHVGRPIVNGEAFTGIFMGDPTFITQNGRAPQINNLRMRPRRNINLVNETPTGATPVNTFGLNDYGFIRVLGDGAVIQDVTFLNARMYDGGTGATGGARGSGNTTIAYTGTSTTNANSLLAQRAGGFGPQANHSHHSNGGNIGGTGAPNLPTHRGIVAGRVAPNATVTIANVNIGNSITAASNDDARVTAAGFGVNIISTSRHHGIWNARIGGMIGVIAPGASVNVSDSDVSVRLLQQALGSWNQSGGLVATNYGRLYVSNVNIASEMTESHWGHNHSNNTMYAGGLVGRNAGTIDFAGNDQSNNHIHMITIREGQTDGFNNGDGGGTGNLSGRNWGHFNHAGRITAFSSGAVSIRNVDLTGNIFGLQQVGGVIGSATAPLTLNNVNVTGTIGGTRTGFDTTVTPRETRPQNAGGLVGRTTALVYANNVTVSGNIFGSRGSNLVNTTTGGFIGAGQSALINNSQFISGTLNDSGDGASGGNVGGFIGRATGSVVINHSEVLAGTTLQAGVAATRNRQAGRGGLVGVISPTGVARFNYVTNHANVSTSRGFAGGLIGRMQGRDLIIENSTNRGNISTTLSPGLVDQWRATGGFVGQTDNTNVTIRNSANYGAISGITRRRGTAGFIGSSFGASNTIRLENVTNNGNITRGANLHGNAGGLLGWMRGNVVIIDSTNNAPVLSNAGGGATTANSLGGLVARVNRNLTIENSVNNGNVANSQNAPMIVGGVVGYVRGRVNITDTANFGNVTSTITSAGRRNHSRTNTGGIIGRSDTGGVTSGQRQVVLTNVTNHGQIGGTGTGTTDTVNNTVGGIIGRTVSRTGTSYTITNATNYGNIRGRNHVGGVIGWSDALNTSISNAANHGNINSFWGNSDARGHIGGIVGRTSRNNFTIHQSYNTGDVNTLGASGHAALTTASMGGFIGHRSAGGVTITESFNAGHIHGVDRNTAGFVGLSRGSGGLAIRNSYNIGTITARTGGSGAALTRRQRSGNGILGFRAAGSVIIENVYNAGRTQGRPIYGSPAVAPNGNIGTYMTFRNVYFDTSVHTGIAQTISRGTIAGVSTDLMTRGILPGVTGPAWLSGVRLADGETYWNTYPYLAWQTGGVLEERFMTTVREQGTDYGFMDLDGTGSRTAVLNIPGEQVGAVRYFVPYVSASVGQFDFKASENTTVTINEAGPRSLGLVSENWVVGFDIIDRVGIAVIAVDAINDYSIPWAEFEVDGIPFPSVAGIIILVVPESGVEIDLSAFGYEDTNYFISDALYQADPTGMIRIPMNRIDIEHVRVELRYLGGTADDPTSNIVPNSWLEHERYDNNPFGPYPQEARLTPAPRHFMLDTVQWYDLLHGGADNFSLETLSLMMENFVYISDNPSATDPHIVHMYLYDLRHPNLILNLVWYEDWDAPGDDDETPRRVNIIRTGTTNNNNVVGAHVAPTFRQPEGVIANAPTMANTTSVSAHQWNITHPLIVTELQIGAAGFRTSDFLTISDLFEYNEPANEDQEPVRSNQITVDLERLIRLTVNVVVQTGYNAEGLPTFGPPSARADLVFNDDYADADLVGRNVTRVNDSSFLVTGVDGEEVMASVPGYANGFHVFNFLDDVTTRHSSSADFVGSTGTVTIVLVPLDLLPRTVIFEYAPGPEYGTVAVYVDGEYTANAISHLPGSTLSIIEDLEIIITENNAEFSHWVSDSDAHGSGLFTTEQIMNLEIPEGVTIFTAYFASPIPVTFAVIDETGGEIAAEGVRGEIESGDEVLFSSNVIFTATPDPGYEVLEWTVNGEVVNVNGLVPTAETVAEILATMAAVNSLAEWLAGAHNRNADSEFEIELINDLQLNVGNIREALHVTVEFVEIEFNYTFDFGTGFADYNTYGTVTYADDFTPVVPGEIPNRPGYRLTGWTPIVGPISEDTDFVAIWTPNDAVTITFDPNGGAFADTEELGFRTVQGEFSLAQLTPAGTIPELVIPRVGWTFDGWYIDGDDTLPFTVDTPTVMGQDMTVVALWTRIYVGVSYEVVDNSGGDLAATFAGTPHVSGAQVPHGSTVTFTATPDAGHEIIEWRVNGQVVTNLTDDAEAPVDIEDLVTEIASNLDFMDWVKNEMVAVTTDASLNASGLTLTVADITASTHVTVEFAEIIFDYLFDFGTDFATYNKSGSVRYQNDFTPAAPTNIPINVGYRFDGWSLVEGETTAITVGAITEDTTFYAIWTPMTVDFRFDWGYTDGVVAQHIDRTEGFNYLPTLPAFTAAPYRAGQHVIDWTPAVHRITNTEERTVFTAVWGSNADVQVNFHVGAGELVGASYRLFPAGLTVNDHADGMPADPTRNGGYRFAGWFIDADPLRPFDGDYAVNTPLNVYAAWEEIFVTYTFDFDPDNEFDYFDATEYNVVDQLIRYGLTPDAPTNIPINVGYRFVGWDSVVGPVTADTTFNAIWEETDVDYRFDWMFDDGVVTQIIDGTIGYNGIPTPPTTVPTRPGYHHSGWTPVVGRVTNRTEPTVFRANWTPNELVRVNFDVNGGNLVGADYRLIQDGLSLGILMPATPTRSGGFTFAGWFIDGNPAYPFTATTVVTGPGPINVVAAWDDQYFNYDFEFNPTGVFTYFDADDYNTYGQIRYGLTPTAPADIPINVGYRFDGWNPVVGPITTTTTFNAIWWRTNVQYGFDWNYGEATRVDGLIEYNTFASTVAPAVTGAPARPGYHVAGWSTTPTGQIVDLTTIRINNRDARTIFYAVWEANREIDVIFDLDGGNIDGATADITVTVQEGQTVGTNMPADPQRDGYDFVGWFIAGEQSRPFAATTTVSDALVAGQDTLTVVAVWRAFTLGVEFTGGINLRVASTDVDWANFNTWLIERAEIVATRTTESLTGITTEPIPATEIDVIAANFAGMPILPAIPAGTSGQFLVLFDLPGEAVSEIIIVLTIIAAR